MWRNTGLTPKLGPFDVKSFLFFLPFLLHMSTVTFYLGITGVLFFTVLNFLNIGFKTFFLMLRTGLFGGIRPTYNRHFRRRMWYVK